ncbi:unnamed protein product [Mycena citricolor]|uniref:Alpha-type protein kinase domain-containing protein n=1 Tax=Mycena citricolor TaxID=2018698 RepID=A0AAD2HJS7_9AGAR|nr:unnamed protein product [Mycena citricolor]
MSDYTPSIKASFTGEGASHGPIPCDRGPDCRGNQWIAPTETRRKVRNKNPNLPDRTVCCPCYEYYCNKSSSTVSARNGATSAQPTPSMLQDAAIIRRQNIDARVNNSAPKANDQLVAIAPGLMGPPARITGPHISLPNMGGFALPLPPPQQPVYSSKGYSANHAQYSAARAGWAHAAYAGATPETISLIIGVRYEILGKPKGGTFGAISEGVVVDARATPRTIIQTVFDNVYGKLRVQILRDTKNGFEFDTTNFTVRDVAKWIDLKRITGDLFDAPFYYASCFKTGRAKAEKDRNIKVFTSPAPISVALVIDLGEWLRLTDFLDDMQIAEAAESGSATVDGKQPVTRKSSRKASTLRSYRRTTRSSTRSSASTCSVQQNPSHVSSTEGSTATFDAEQVASAVTLIRTRFGSSALSDLAPGNSSSLIGGHLAGASWGTNELRPVTPPQSLSRKRSAPEYRSPDQQRLKKALSEGGSLKKAGNAPLHISEHIEFYRILPVDLHDLLENPSFFTCDIKAAEFGTLSMVPSEEPLGVGSFKSAHNARLNLNIVSTGNILGSVPNQHVAAKRMFELWSEDKERLRRFAPQQEYIQTIREANILVWAVSLLEFCYAFIADFIKKNGKPPADLKMFNIRFVEAGLALIHDSSAAGHNVKDTSSLRRTFLIEELIKPTRENQDETFIKFIHNNLAAPTPTICSDSLNYAVAEFLCFTQHIQYEKSGGNVFLSDLQGSPSRLSDPQIMTTPEIKERIFGGGNIRSAFQEFPTQHKCSRYCEFFKLTPLSTTFDEQHYLPFLASIASGLFADACVFSADLHTTVHIPEADARVHAFGVFKTHPEMSIPELHAKLEELMDSIMENVPIARANLVQHSLWFQKTDAVSQHIRNIGFGDPKDDIFAVILETETMEKLIEVIQDETFQETLIEGLKDCPHLLECSIFSADVFPKL